MTRSRTDSPTTALGNSGYQSAGERLEVKHQAVAGPAHPFAHELVKIVGLGKGKVPHGEIVDHEQGRLGQGFEPGGEAAVGVAAGQLGQHAASRSTNMAS